MKQRKLFWIAAFLVGAHLMAGLAGFFAPYHYSAQDRLHPYAPPSLPHIMDCSGKIHLHPFVYGIRNKQGSFTEYQADCSAQMPVRFLVSGEEYSLFGMIPSSLHLFGVSGPGEINLLGTDGFGRDQFSRVLYGAQVSLLAGGLAGALAVFAGVIVGTIAGFYGGLVDEATMRVAEIAIAVPSLYLLLAARSFLPLQIGPFMAFLLVIAVIGLLSWARPARLVRGVVMSAKERNFVLAAQGFGASKSYVMRRHLVPMTFSVALTQLAILVPQFILAEVVLSFLGLGIGEPFPSWGNMLAEAQQYHVLTSCWWMLLPGLAPVPFFVAYHALADAIQKKTKVNL
jgi:peptide/nickel transport system permease protein